MALFVINEWLWADSAGDNGKKAQSEAFDIIRRLANSNHQIIIIEGSAFDLKAWDLCRISQPVVIGLVKAFVTSIRQNSQRCLLLKADVAASLPDELAHSVKVDDHYLIRAQLSFPGSVLITTDRPLRDVVVKAGLPCRMRDEFFAEDLES